MATTETSKGVGPGRKKLTEVLAESERLYELTKCYAGLKEFHYKTEDPIRYEVFHSKLLSSTIAAREMARMISGSAILREVAELCFVLFTAEGDVAAHSIGLLAHVRPMSKIIKWTIREDYEDKVGIKDGDIFEVNDPSVGGIQTCDVYTFLPIFWNEELVAWAGSITHESDPGATDPGGQGCGQIESFFDGVHEVMEKIGEQDKLKFDYEKKIERTVRYPNRWILDTKARIAGCIKMRDAVKEMIAEFGKEYYLGATKELIEEERRAMQARLIQRTIPGRYRENEFLSFAQSGLNVPFYAKKDFMTHIALEVNIDPDGRLRMDYDGTGSWGYHSCNMFPTGAEASACLVFTQSLAYDGRVNEGTLLDLRINIPRGTIANPDYPFVGTSCSWSVLGVTNYRLLNCLNRAYFARGYKEEIFIMAGAAGSAHFGGTDQYGKTFGMWMAECAGAGGSGARGVADGLDTGYVHFNPESDIGNAEIWELFFPMLYIGRRTGTDIGGYGKFRGANGLVSTWMAWNTGGLYSSHLAAPTKERILHGNGLFGGYPSPRMYSYYVTKSNAKDVISKRSPLPHSEGDIRNPDIAKLVKGDLHKVGTFHISEMLYDYDLYQFYYIWVQGGYGDPIERNPELVREDLENGLTTVETASNVYAVVLRKGKKGWAVNAPGTAKARAEVLVDRKRRGVPFKRWWKKERRKLREKKIDKMVMDMYFDAFSRSQKFKGEFSEFWGLPKDFAESKN